MPRKSAHPYVSWRGGRPRFTPSPTLRKAGHQPHDLKHPDGTWFTRGQAVDWSQDLMARLKAKPAPKRGRPVAALRQRITLGALVEKWQREGRRWREGSVEPYSKTTRRDYRQKLKVLQDDFPDVWVQPAEALHQPIMQRMYEEIEINRGLATARGVMVILQGCFKWAMTRGHIKMAVNPLVGLDKTMPPPRIRFATRAELAALVAAADGAGRHDVADAIIMGVWTGQRQADRLALQHRGMLKGRRIFRQAKTGAIVHILEAPELEARLAAAQQRRNAAGIDSPTVLLNENTWRPWKEDNYRHEFAKVRDQAAGKVKGKEAARADAIESVATLRDQDLRDTAVTWMALAGADIPQIISVTGHSAASAHAILKHYLAQHPQMADEAIRKMISWYDAGGETEIG